MLSKFKSYFGKFDYRFFTASGRTEILGNHTDHQRGRVLAGSVNLSARAVAAKNNSDKIHIISEGFCENEIDIKDLNIKEDEKNTTAALIRGVVKGMENCGIKSGGFNAYITSNVLGGSGLSSSAAFEVLIGVIINGLFGDSKLSPTDIAKIGQFAENVYFGKPCGLMDQMACSVGGAIAIDFKDSKDPVVEKLEYDFSNCGHSLCIIDSGADHANLTDEYASIPYEMCSVAKYYGKEVLRDVDEELFYSDIKGARAKCGDRAILRAAHFYAENKRVLDGAAALKHQDFDKFLSIIKESGLSSFTYLQNVYTSKVRGQAVPVSLMLAQKLLSGRGAFRVHGGGFAGTIQSFVPNDMLSDFKSGIDAVLGEGSCHVLSISPVGGAEVKEGF